MLGKHTNLDRNGQASNNYGGLFSPDIHQFGVKSIWQINFNLDGIRKERLAQLSNLYDQFTSTGSTIWNTPSNSTIAATAQ